MDIVLDANVLFRTLISSGSILDIIFHQSLHIYAPQQLKVEFLAHQQEIIKKSHLPRETVLFLTEELFKKIIFVNRTDYEIYLPKAKNLLKGHNKDEDFIALCIAKKCKLWTYEKRLCDIGFGISTKQLSDSFTIR